MKDERVYWRTHFRNSKGTMDKPEVIKRLTAIGFVGAPARPSRAVSVVRRGAEYLYCHPADLSGYVLEDTVNEVIDALAGSTFIVGRVDRYNKALNYTEDEYRAALSAMEADLMEQVIRAFTTKRRNLYLHQSALESVRSGLPHFRIGVVGATIFERIERSLVAAILDRLVSDGRILTAQRGDITLYRTRMPKDPPIVAPSAAAMAAVPPGEDC